MQPGWVRVIRVHYCPDLDVYGAVGLIAHFASEIMSNDVRVEFVPSGQALEDLPGYLTLDTGGGEFDHHGKNGRCTTDLIATAIGIADLLELQDVFTRFREQDLRGRDVLRGAFPKNHASVSLKSLVDASHLFDIRSEAQNSGCIRIKSFWFMVLVVEAIIVAAQNQMFFQSHGEWRNDLEEAFLNFLWQRNAHLVGDHPCPGSIAEALNVLDLGMLDFCEGQLTYRQDEGGYPIVSFFTDRQWFTNGHWQPEAALFSICGIAQGLISLNSQKKDRLNALQDCLERLFLLPCDEAWGLANVSNLDTCRMIRDGDRLVIACVKSDTFSAAAKARAAGGNVVITWRSYGQIQISLDRQPSLQFTLYKLGITLRIAECLQQKRQFSLQQVDYMGRSDLVPEWYLANYEDNPDRVFLVSNRTKTNPVEPQTQLTLASIMRLTQYVFHSHKIPDEATIRFMLKHGQREGRDWPHDPNRPRLFADIREVHG
ncbi:MAG: hypothetical protein NTZ18_04295 [Candidatus Komeilibacteria bacterium]|nr:hypothetical protein [Candidatus Komeilibacteria bacterium]